MTSRLSASVAKSIRIASAILASWMIPAAFFSWEDYDLAVRIGDAGDYAMRFYSMAAPMLIWALFTPPLVYVAQRLPLRKPHWLRNGFLLCLTALAVAAVRARIDVALGFTLGRFIFSVATLLHIHFLYALVVLGVASFIRLEQDQRTRRHDAARSEAEAAQASLRRLRADLNPHFLFNTLNAVAMLLHRDRDAAAEMLDKLREFLTTVVATEHAREIRLADELEFVSRYFDIQKMRFSDKLTTAIQLSDPRLGDAAVPPLLLQPLVENSIIHGIALRPEGGCVAVIADEHRNSDGLWLRIVVRDDGLGFRPAAPTTRAGMGVANIRARLESQYGARQSLTYEREGDAFVAKVLIPLRVAPR